MVSWFEVIFFSQPPKKITKDLFFPETPCTTPVNSFLDFLENTSLTSSSNSPIFALTTVSTTILSPPPLNFCCVRGGDSEKKHWKLRCSWRVECIVGRVLRACWASGCFFFSKKNKNPKNRTACRPTFSLRLTIPFACSDRALNTFTSWRLVLR